MDDKFIQKVVLLDPSKSVNELKISELIKLVDNHPYKDKVYEAFGVDEIGDELIKIDFIDTVYERVSYYCRNYRRHSIRAEIQHINLYQEKVLIEERLVDSIIFHFDEYIIIDEVRNDLKAVARYDSKNTYLDQYKMTKYANHLFSKGWGNLAKENIEYFKELASRSDNYNKHKSYRLVEYKGQNYVRGITSIEKYYEYGVDFTFVVSMLTIYEFMKSNQGVEYGIKSASLNESKLEIIISEKGEKNAGEFGKVSTALKVSTNDLGQGSLNFLNIINVVKENAFGFYLFPKSKNSSFDNSRIPISHTTKPKNAFVLLNDVKDILNTSDEFIKELNTLKTINTPDELRLKIQSKIEGPKSVFKGITALSEIFKKKIDNDITNFSKLLDMCNKAEELNIEYDLKDKLRYIISDIILYGKHS